MILRDSLRLTTFPSRTAVCEHRRMPLEATAFAYVKTGSCQSMHSLRTQYDCLVQPCIPEKPRASGPPESDKHTKLDGRDCG